MKRTFLILTASAAALMFGPASGTAAESSLKAKKSDPTDSFFGSAEVLKIRIEIPPEGIAKLGKYQWQFGPQSEREDVSVTVREGTKTFTNVALHLKGAAGSFRPITANPAMTLNFDKNVRGQRFHGLTKFSLNNSVQDPTFVSEQFCRELFLKVGVPAPRATHAVVELNGRDLGVYVLVEGFNKQFLKRHFKNADGNLYDGGFLKDIDSELALNSGDKPKDQSARIALKEAAQEPDLQKRLARLEKTLDVDRFLTYLALDIMLWDWDGYAQNRNNWRLYHDPGTGKMVFIPHGLDQMFWKPEGPLLPPVQGMVARSVLQVPELRARYFQRVKELRTSVFQPEALTNRVYALSAKISPVLKGKGEEPASEQQKAVEKLCDAIVRRARNIDEQLATPITPLRFDESGSAVLARWESKADFGRPAMSREPGPNGKDMLRVGTSDGSSIGTWRIKVWLEPGRYQIEGRIKTQNVIADIGDPRGGAALRLGRSRSEHLLGSNDWKNVTDEFSVDDPLSEVQVICEFRGASGEALFDSVRLNKLSGK